MATIDIPIKKHVLCVKCNKLRDAHLSSTECNFPLFIPLTDCDACADAIAAQKSLTLRKLLIDGVKTGGHVHTHNGKPFAAGEFISGFVSGGSQRGNATPHALFRKGMEIGALADEKRELYGDSAAQYEAFLKLLYPDGIPLSSARDAGLMLRIFDKFKRIATRTDHDGENPWDDAAGYALIGAAGEKN